jgi:hypothetical protein
MTKVEFTVTGYVVGPIWWPVGEECYKHFSYNLTCEDERFTEPATLREHVLSITNDGDFQYSEIADGFLTATIRKPGRARSRNFPLDMFPSIKDCIKDDWCGPSGEDY